eukprot:998517-Amphidinium_carterae.5
MCVCVQVKHAVTPRKQHSRARQHAPKKKSVNLAHSTATSCCKLKQWLQAQSAQEGEDCSEAPHNFTTP